MSKLILLRSLSVVALVVLGVLVWYFTQTLSTQPTETEKTPVETPEETPVETPNSTETETLENPITEPAAAENTTAESTTVEDTVEENIVEKPENVEESLPLTLPEDAEKTETDVSATLPEALPETESATDEKTFTDTEDTISLDALEPTAEESKTTGTSGKGLGDVTLNPVPLMARESETKESEATSETPVEEKEENAEPAKKVVSEEYRPSRRGIDPSKPFDPVAENGAIFEGWPKPDVTLVLTGRLNGYLEPCGCAGMERMTGGLSRRATFFDQLTEKGWNPAFLDTGGISHGYSQQARIKFLSAANMLREMGYDAVSLGNTDLMFPAGDLLSEVTNPGRSSKLFTSANVGIFTMDPKTLVPAKILVRDGVRIGIVGILGEEEQEEVRNDEIQLGKVRTALDKVIPALKAKTDFIVLLAYSTVEEATEYAKTWPDIDIVVAAKGAPVPPSAPEVLESGQYLITIGEKGMHVIVLGLYNDNQNPVRYQRVPMDSRFESSPKIHDLMALYQDQLAVAGLEGLGIRPLKNPRMESNGTYVGSEKCESCHQEAYEKWLHSRHNKAWKSLKESKPPRTADPECIVCHVVGWNVEHQTPYESGFLNMEKTPKLSKVGCESCHGPGSRHVEAEMGTDEAVQAQFRTAVRLTLEDAKKSQCITCHDLDNSPNFDFDEYWPVIVHPTETEE